MSDEELRERLLNAPRNRCETHGVKACEDCAPSDTAPQPPPGEQPVQTLARLLEEAGAVPVICGIPLNTTLEERITLLLDRIAALEATIEADRTRIIDAVNALERVVNGKFWLTEGRGSYEWNDDRYRKEFGEAVRSMLKAVEPLRKIGADLTNCPQTTAEVVKARADKDAKIAALEAQLAEAKERLAMAVEALSKIANGGVGDITASCNLEPGDCALVCNWCGDASYPIDHADGCPVRIAEAAIAAATEAVAQHTASVERRGADRFRKRFIAVMEWCVKRVRTAAKDEDYDVACDDVINKLVWFADWTRTADGAAELDSPAASLQGAPQTVQDARYALTFYRKACAAMHQFAGCFIPHVPAEVLDNLSALADGEAAPHEWPMPLGVETLEAVERRGAAKELEAES